MQQPSRLYKSIALLATLSALMASCTAAPAAPAAAPAAPAKPAEAVAAPAGEMKLQEAPMLAEMVAAGKIPKLEDRIPKQPFMVGPGVLVEAADLPDWKPGKYGGTLRSAHSVANWSPDFFVMGNESLLISPGISSNKIQGNVLRDYKVSEDGKTITFNLREGMKWSDGEPVTTEDIRFTYEDILKNTDLTKNFPGRWKSGASASGQEPTITIVDPFTFQMSYPEPYGGILRQFTIEGWVGYTEWLNPAHHLKKFHAKYAKPDDLKKLLADAKLKDDEWVALFNKNRCLNWDVNQPRCIGYPSLNPWTLKSSDNSQLSFERNPYYFKVDNTGQQLPYLDKLVSTQVQDVEGVNLKILAGEVDFMRESTALVKIPLYKENEDKAGIKVVLLDMHVNSSGLEINETFTNTEQSADWAKYAGDAKFRKALSMAINRPEIIETIYYGYAALPLKTVGEDASKYDVDAANKLLDEIGLTKKDADGMRLGSDGKQLIIQLEHGAHAPDLAPIAEIVGADLKKIGISVNVKKIDTTLWGTRRGSNDLMSTIFWSHDQNGAAGLGVEDSIGRAGRVWAQYNASQGKSGVKPPDWAQQGYDIMAKWWSSVPGSAEYTKLTEDGFAWQRTNLPYITIVENVKYPMVVSKKLGNVASGGFAIACNFAGEQLYFTE
jgi:peptide/nickel transport system substrate-binding protein